MWGLSKKDQMIVIGCFLCSFVCTFFSMSLLSAMKEISEELHTDFSYVMWMTEASFISAIMFSIITVAIANKYGKRTTHLIGLAIMMASGIMSAFSNNINALSLSKIVAGVGVAFITISNMSIIADKVDKIYIGEAMATNYALSCFGAAIGPLLGLFLLSYIGWRELTFIVVPISLFLIIILWNEENTVYDSESNIDYLSHFLFIIGMGCVLNAFFINIKHFWVFWVGLAILIIFLLLQKYRRELIIDPSVFRNKLFVVSAVLGFLFYFATYCIDDAIVDKLEFLDETTFVIFGMTVSFVAFAGFLRGLKPMVQLIASPLFARMGRGVNPMKLTLYAFILLLLAPVIDLIAKFTELDMLTVAIIAVIIFLLLALSSSIFSPQNKGIMIECVEKNQRNTASSIITVVDNLGRLFGVMIMVNILDMFGDTTAESLEVSTTVAIIAVLFALIIGIILAYIRKMTVQ